MKLRQAAEALVAGDAPRAWFEADGARRLASGPGDAPLALAALGVMAEASARSGQAARAGMELDSLAASLRAGGAAWAAARVEARRLALVEAPAALAVEAVRVADAPAGRQDHEVVGALAAAAQVLRGAGRDRVAEDEPAAAIPLLDAAATLFGFLSTSTVLQQATPSAVRAEIALERARAQAEVALSRARLAERAGLLDEALAAARQAVAVTPAGEEAPAQALVGRLALALGGFAEADAATAEAGLAGAAAVENRLIRARLRLAEGRWAAAFAHANRGLRALRRGGLDDRRLRVACITSRRWRSMATGRARRRRRGWILRSGCSRTRRWRSIGRRCTSRRGTRRGRRRRWRGWTIRGRGRRRAACGRRRVTRRARRR